MSIDLKDKKFDGRVNFEHDDKIEDMLIRHFQEFKISPLDAVENFQIHARRIFLKRFLAHYELFRMTANLPGDIIELGVYKGNSLFSWANFLEIFNMGDRQKQVFGFDNFAGFTELSKEDGARCDIVEKSVGGFNCAPFEEALEDSIKIFDADRFIPYKPRVRLIKGNIEETIPKFVEENSGLRISLLHFDCDMYKPTMIGLKHLFPLVVNGGVILFDEYGIRPWAGESAAVDEFFKSENITIKKFNWSPNPGGYIIK